jgi:feruloyl esterase
MTVLTHARNRHRRWLAWLGLAALILPVSLLTTGLTTAAASAARQSPASASTSAKCSPGYLASNISLPAVTVVSAVFDTSGSFTPPGTTTPITGLPDFCAVALTQTDQAGNPIHIAVWLPAKWNGRFQGIGGGGYSCGITYTSPGVAGSLQEAVDAGYAGASTDCGVPPADGATGSWALTSSGHLNWPLITDFASAGMHDMTVAGQAVTGVFYPGKVRDSYFYGCSTGGREGLMEAQRYPADYNGIVSGAPAINWTRFIPAEIWPALVMNQMHDALPTCKKDAFTAAVIKACDARDGVTDGIISNLGDCHWNADQLIGAQTPCGTITATDAAVMNKIWAGPASIPGIPLWYGLERGASLAGLGATTTANGVTTPSPFPIAASWLGTWLQQNPNWDWTTLTYAQFDKLFAQSVREFSSTIATDNPDLSAFRNHGGKILIWHGLADQLIFPQGTIQYYQRVQHAMGGPASTGSFARLFLAPGAQHCASAVGPAPADPLAAVVNWVEHGQAPHSILATVADPATGTVTLSRPLCAYPLVARYAGHGSASQAQNFICARHYSRQ